MNESSWPSNVSCITFATPEDAQKMLNVYEEYDKKMSHELEALWIHVRNLEEKLLAKSEVPNQKWIHGPGCY